MRSFFAALAVFIFLQAGCKKSKLNVDSSVQHERGDIIGSYSEWKWTALTEAEFEKTFAFFQETGKSRYHPKDHALSVFADKWIEKIHEALVKKHPEIANVPKPFARVDKHNALLNAFSTSAWVCLEVPFNRSRTQPARYSGLYLGGLSVSVDPNRCLVRTSWNSNVKAVVELFNRTQSSCELSVGQKGVEIVKGCNSIASGSKLAFATTANFIAVWEGLAFAMPDDPRAFVSILAHELGHYYHAHAALFGSPDYDLFYTFSDTPGRPERNANAEKMGRELQKVWVPTTYPIPLKEISPYLFEKAYSIINRQATQSGCPSGANCSRSCKALVQDDGFEQMLPKLTPQNVLGKFSAASIQKLQQLESKLLLCAESIPFNADAEGVERLYAPMGVSSGTHTVIENQIAASNWRDFFVKASQQYNAYIKKHRPAFEKAWSEKLSWYTYEQEADELTAEIFDIVGINPLDAVKGFLALSNSQYALGEEITGAWNGQKCLTGLSSLWKNMFVPVGDVAEPHHSGCFRAFNVAREITKHNYNTNTPDLTSFESEWKVVARATLKAKFPDLTEAQVPLMQKGLRCVIGFDICD